MTLHGAKVSKLRCKVNKKALGGEKHLHFNVYIHKNEEW